LFQSVNVHQWVLGRLFDEKPSLGGGVSPCRILDKFNHSANDGDPGMVDSRQSKLRMPIDS
jgi:hypothetical protein